MSGLLRFGLFLLVTFGLGTFGSPAQTAPVHVKTYLYYGATHLNESIPPSYIAARADFAEADAGQPEMANKFKDAGGRFSIMYTDPFYVPHCMPPFSEPAGPCTGPIGNMRLPGDAWLHGPSGARLHRGDDYTHQYQDALNPASPAARAAYRAFTSEAARRARVDFFFADDSGVPLRGPDGTSLSGAFYRFDEPGVEVNDDNRFLAGMRGMLASAVRPVIVNGSDRKTLQPAYGGELLQAPNVMGENQEGCFVASWYRDPLGTDKWRTMANGLLAVTNLHRYAVCMLQGDGLKDPLKRLYGVASWWMTYDPEWSVIAPVSPGADGLAVFSEEAIVPTQPLRSAHSDVDELRAGSAYVREFGACFEAGHPIGRCAAVVNTSGSTTAFPHLAQSYGSRLDLSSNSSFGGGKNTWTHGLPETLGGLQAQILRQ